MSQNNIPPEHRDPPGAGEPPEDRGNPYFSSSRQPEVEDLDSAAPSLRSEEGQRLNRRALLFMGATLLLILVMAAMFLKMFNSGQDKPEATRQARVERPLVPDAPQVEPALPAASAEPATPVAPLPLEEPQEFGRENLAGARREQRPAGPSLVERRIADSGASVGGNAGGAPMGGPDGLGTAPTPRNGEPGTQPPIQAQLGDVSAASYLQKPDTLLLRGTYIRCVLETHIVTDVSGFTSCIVTEPVYSVNGKSLLLPKGSKVSGTYSGGGGRTNRVAVVWDRITTPTGIDVMMSSPGVDNLGGAGHPGDLNNHWASKITSALMISLIADAFKYEGQKHGPQRTTITENGTTYIEPYESETAQAMQRLSEQMISQQMARSPTVTINQGTVLNVYVAKDVDFSGVLPSYQ
ncbi:MULTISPECIES: TrbI/VirB10 family protein [Pseudoxanthomonas]|uniref:Type IV secretion system protein VirB10 n=1 Tax=Pseudoxanthomonas winnipegensis TaxID=2480810 RepID=A0AAW8GBI1_9GAMM|nr:MULTISPECIES: TrbI/VirB10 family protein [Pseudoxanthomonas]MDQ1119774.1 type IV secretion system protein VirB10 [Pseudoxanthomonas winnipegensis]MDQ1132972.1 type IV secretion system protein VirB10 [Pseudoxanthomonas winnipegensis]MDR6137023.1 type IV secretion system protein VirB10 [Pseudoxanthomonas sp. SORGH_AS_0997]